MENKYYTPDISEFCVGFEYEVEDLHDNLVDKVWKKEVLEVQDELLTRKSWIGNLEARVKYLDKEDVESLGFTIDDTHESLMSDDKPEQIDYMFYSKNYGNEYKLLYCNWWTTVSSSKEGLDGKITIDNIDEHRIVRIQKRVMSSDEYSTIFLGDIKNKSELKRVLKMIGYASGNN